MDTVLLFPTPLFRFFYHNCEELKKSAVSQLLNLEESDRNSYQGKYPTGSYTSFYNGTNALDLEYFENLKLFIRQSVEEAHRRSGLGGELAFTRSWFSINRKYSYHEQHHHCPNVWSGVYYVQAANDDATICFVNKNIIDSSWPFNSTKLVNNEVNSSQTVCKVSTGMLLIFPSYLQHKVDQQLADTDRISIAFNMDVK